MNTNSIEVVANVTFTKHEGVITRTLNKVEIPSKALDVKAIIREKAMNDAKQNLLALQVANGVIHAPFSATEILGHRTAKGWQTLNKLAAVVKAIDSNPAKATKLTESVNAAIEKAERKTAVNCDLIHTAAKGCGLIAVAAVEGQEKEKPSELQSVAANAAKYTLAAFLTEYSAQMLDKGAITLEQSKALKAAINTK